MEARVQDNSPKPKNVTYKNVQVVAITKNYHKNRENLLKI